jgi:hypothetical protein
MDDHVLSGDLLGQVFLVSLMCAFFNLGIYNVPPELSTSRLVTIETQLSNFLSLPHVVAGSNMLMKSAMST